MFRATQSSKLHTRAHFRENPIPLKSEMNLNGNRNHPGMNNRLAVLLESETENGAMESRSDAGPDVKSDSFEDLDSFEPFLRRPRRDLRYQLSLCFLAGHF